MKFRQTVSILIVNILFNWKLLFVKKVRLALQQGSYFSITDGSGAMSSQDGEFILVKGRKNRRRKKKVFICGANQSKESDGEFNQEELNRILRKVQDCKDDLKHGYYFCFYQLLLETFEKLQKTSDESVKPVRIVCYGIGNFGESSGASYQLALIMLIQEKFNIPMEFFDPVLTNLEKHILVNKYKFEVIAVNEYARRKAVELTIFYLPHLSHQLVNNLLFENWTQDDIQKCILISNSLGCAPEHLGSDRRFSLLLSAYKICAEHDLPYFSQFWHSFQNMSIHVFPDKRTRLVDEEFWFQTTELFCDKDFDYEADSNVEQKSVYITASKRDDF